MRINYKHFVIGGLALNFMLVMSPIQAVKQRMVCPSDGKRPMFNVICPGGEEPIPIEEYENKSRPPSDSGGKSRRNCSRMPNGKVSAECDSPVIVTKTSRQAFEPEMVDIPAGCFQMGSPETESGHSSDESPQHRVCVEAFAMGKYEITNAQFRQFRSSHNSGEYEGHSLNDDNQPVVKVTWNDAVAYTQWLSQKTGKNYRLPSEAEWEYAARAGTTTARYWGSNPDQACRYENVHDETSKRINKFDWTEHNCDDGYAVTAPVGQFQPNDFGLYDMLGNVWEWNQDKWHSSYAGAPTDGSAWESGDSNSHLLRGCSWYARPGGCRSANRGGTVNSNYNYGVRVVAAVSSP